MAKGNFKLSDTCDKEFNKINQSFSMTAEYARLKGDIDHNVLLDVGQSLPDQAFNARQDAKKVRVHPTNPKKTTSIASARTSVYESVLVEFHRERREIFAWCPVVSSRHAICSQGTCRACTKCGSESKTGKATSPKIR
jgi:hypothetical protein